MGKNSDNSKHEATDMPPWDERAALEATGGDASLARELLKALVQGLPGELTELHRHFHQANWPLLAETAHRLRGATSYCGVPTLDACLQKLEQTAKSGDRDRMEIELAQIEAEAKRLMHALQDQPQ